MGPHRRIQLLIMITILICGGLPAVSSSSSRSEPVREDGVLATLGGGCFWCIEAVFDELEGVSEVASGYAGGEKDDPSYAEVCAGTTGHAEVVQLRFDPAVVSYEEILAVFFTVHDPTTLNRQGADEGTQYRSVILYHDEAQKAAAEAVIAALDAEGIWPRPIVTELAAYERFYEAERYHQEYYARNSRQPYCVAVIDPKLQKFREKFSHQLKD